MAHRRLSADGNAIILVSLELPNKNEKRGEILFVVVITDKKRRSVGQNGAIGAFMQGPGGAKVAYGGRGKGGFSDFFTMGVRGGV